MGPLLNGSPPPFGDLSSGPESPTPSGNTPGLTRLVWVLALPLAAVYFLVSALMLPHLVQPRDASGGLEFFASVSALVLPEPLEQARFLLALTFPLMLAGLSIGLSRKQIAGNGRKPNSAVLIQVLLTGLVAIAWWEQQRIFSYFAAWQLVLAAILGALVTPAIVWLPRALGRRLPRAARPLTAGRWALPAAGAFLVALAATAPSYFTDSNIAGAIVHIQGNMPYVIDEFAAAAMGRHALVDFTPQYATVLPYLAAPLLRSTGLSVQAISGLMCSLTLVALMAVFVVFARVVRRPFRAFGLFAAFVLLALHPSVVEGDQIFDAASYYPALPLRYLGPFLVLLAVSGLAIRLSPIRVFGTFALTGLVLINNIDFGLPALGGAGAALLAAAAWDRPLSLARLARLSALAAAGVAGAFAAFALFTLAAAGELPNFGLLFYFARQFALSGFYMLPMPALGLQSVIFLTFAAAVVTAAILAAQRSTTLGRPMTMLLAYSGIFGLGAMTYYVGRSHPFVLMTIFPAWALCLCLLSWSAAHLLCLGASHKKLLVVPAAILFAHLALPATYLPMRANLVNQPSSLQAGNLARVFDAPAMDRFVKECTEVNEKVMLAYPMGYRIASRTGVDNHFPYNGPRSIVTTQQAGVMTRALNEKRIDKVFTGSLAPELEQALEKASFRVSAVRPNTTFDPRYLFDLSEGPELRLWSRSAGAC